MINLLAATPWFGDWRIDLVVGLFLPAIVVLTILGLGNLFERAGRALWSGKTKSPAVNETTN